MISNKGPPGLGRGTSQLARNKRRCPGFPGAVFVNGLPACRIGDAVCGGGVLTTGSPTVLIG